MLQRLLIASAAFVFLAAFPNADAFAQSPRVDVRVYVIHASNEGDEIDPRLEDLRRQLEVFQFSFFRLLDVHARTLPFGSAAAIALPGERTLSIVPQRHDSEGRLRLRLKIGDIIDTTYTIAEGGTLIVGGPRHDGGHLILAVNQNAAR